MEQASYEIKHHQQRNAQARESHTRTTIERLTEMGIDLTNIQMVHWDHETEP